MEIKSVSRNLRGNNSGLDRSGVWTPAVGTPAIGTAWTGNCARGVEETGKLTSLAQRVTPELDSNPLRDENAENLDSSTIYCGVGQEKRYPRRAGQW